MSGWWLRPHIRTCCAANSTRARTEHLPLCFCCWLLFGSFPSRAALMSHAHALAPWPARHLLFFLHAHYATRTWPHAASRALVLLLNVLWCFFLAL